jgi:putative ABC transport system permease protein
MKKGKVGIGFITEMIVLTVICLGLGLGAATAVSQPIADGLLENQVKIAAESQNQGIAQDTFSTDPGAAAEALKPLSELTIHLGADAVLQIILIAILLAIVSSIMGVVYITRYEPMKILSERN